MELAATEQSSSVPAGAALWWRVGRLFAATSVIAVLTAALGELWGALSYLPLGHAATWPQMLDEVLFYARIPCTLILPVVAGQLLFGRRDRLVVGVVLGATLGVLVLVPCIAVFVVVSETLNIEDFIPVMVLAPYAVALGVGMTWILGNWHEGGVSVRRALLVCIAGLALFGASYAYLSDLDARLMRRYDALMGDPNPGPVDSAGRRPTMSFGLGEPAPGRGIFGEDLDQIGPDGLSAAKDVPLPVAMPFAVGAAVAIVLLSRGGEMCLTSASSRRPGALDS